MTVPYYRHRRQARVLSGALSGSAPQGLASTLKGEAIGWFSADDITTGTEQSLPNRNAHLPNAIGPLVRGATSGAEITPSGLSTPGDPDNYVNGPQLDLTGDDVRCEVMFESGITYLDYQNTNANLGGFLGDRAGSTGEFIFRKRNVADNHELNLYWFSSGGSYRSTQSTDTPRPEAIGVAVHRTSAGGGLYAVRFYDTLDGTTWSQVGTMRAQSVAPGSVTTTMKVGYDGSSALDHRLAKVTFWDSHQATPDAPIASPDFAAQLPGTQSFDDAQGNTWTINSTGVDTSDPVLDRYHGVVYAKFTGESDGARITVGSATATSTSQWTQYAAFYKDDWSNSGLQLVCGGDDRIQISSNGVRFGFVKPDGGSEYTPYATVAEIGAIDFENISVRCDWDEDNNTATVYARPGVEDFQEGDWGDAKVVLDGPSTNRRGSSVTVALGAFSASGKLVGGIYRCGSTVAGVYDWEFNPNRDNPTGAQTYNDPNNDFTALNYGGGADRAHCRYVTTSATFFDGADDYLQSDYTPSVQKDSGGYTIAETLHLPSQDFSFNRLSSSESVGNTGVVTFLDSVGQVEVLFMDGTNGTSVDADGSYEDGITFTYVAVVDGDNGRVRLATSRAGFYQDETINPATAAITHNPVRLMSRGYNTGSSASGGVREALIWDRALTQAEMEALVA